MTCPHCLIAFHENWATVGVFHDVDGWWHLEHTACPACNRVVIRLGQSADGMAYVAVTLVRPKVPARKPLSVEVPAGFGHDYKEACLVLADSEKASAALSRRCLQHLLRSKAGVKASDLANEIQQVLDSKQLPSHLAEAIDAVRNIGNFAAHPMKSKQSGEIFDVEPGEAEWCLETLEGLFDFYFVQPAALKKKRDDLDAKLAAAGKPAIK